MSDMSKIFRLMAQEARSERPNHRLTELTDAELDATAAELESLELRLDSVLRVTEELLLHVEIEDTREEYRKRLGAKP